MAKFKENKNSNRRKPNPVTFRKHFPTFEEAIEAIMKADDTVFGIFSEKVTNENNEGEEEVVTAYTPSLKEAIDKIVADFSNYTPDLVENDNIYCTLSVSNNKLTYRLDRSRSFGWMISYTIENGKAIINDVSAQFVFYDTYSTKDIMLDLTSNGWEEVKNVRYNKKED